MLDIDCDIVAGDWDERQDWDGLANRAIAAAIAGAGHEALLAETAALVEISLRLTDDEEIRRLNRDYRGKDKPTNILSFPMLAPEDAAGIADAIAADDAMDILLGDLAVAHETLVSEAAQKGISVEDHLTHLLVHGTLHLLGHDHQEDSEADAMEALETRILDGLGIADPYADGTPGAASALSAPADEMDERP